MSAFNQSGQKVGTQVNAWEKHAIFKIAEPGKKWEDITAYSIEKHDSNYDAEQWAQKLANANQRNVRWNWADSSQGHYVEPEPKMIDAHAEAEFLMKIAQRLERWATESETGGWSTHQTTANRTTANELRARANVLLFPQYS